MKKLILILILPAILLIVGCKRKSEYEFSTHSDTLYRLNKRSSQISYVESSKIITLEKSTNESKPWEKYQRIALNKTKTWHKISIPEYDNLELGLKTRWRNGNLYFIFTAKMFEPQELYPRVLKYFKYFVFTLLDSDGFVIIEKQININDMQMSFDVSGKIDMEINSRIPCTAEDYLLIKDWLCYLEF